MSAVIDSILRYVWLAPIAALVLPIIAFCFVLAAMLGNQVEDHRRAERKRVFESHLPS